MDVCELCKRKARIRCDADQATLCWDCDARVHSANFLVVRHSRNLLCYVCKSPTPWSASGAKLQPTVLICEQCADGSGSGDEEAEEAIQSEEVVVEKNQVVPWSLPPAVDCSSTSSSGESVSGGKAAVSRKRCRTADTSPNRHFCQDEDRDRSPAHSPCPPLGYTSEDEEAPIMVRASSKRKTTSSDTTHPIRADLCQTPQILDLLGRFQGGEMTEYSRGFDSRAARPGRRCSVPISLDLDLSHLELKM